MVEEVTTLAILKRAILFQFQCHFLVEGILHPLTMNLADHWSPVDLGLGFLARTWPTID